MTIKLLVAGPFLTNCYLVSSKSKVKQTVEKKLNSKEQTLSKKTDEILIIDPGGETGKILEKIENQKTKLKYIINTHGHPDHTFANEGIRKITGAKILIHTKEKDFIKFKADKFLKEGDKIKIGDSTLKVLHTPGHTKGSICLLAKNFIFTGDTLFKDGYGRTDLPGGCQKDLEKSLEKLKKILKPGMIVYPGHGQIFKIK
jgi:glyoxylase-like metal-dependent hydrolase (beta-lactamase superfamily II)